MPESNERAERPKVLRSVFLSADQDEILRHVAFRLGITKGDVMRKYIEQGLAADAGELIQSGATS